MGYYRKSHKKRNIGIVSVAVVALLYFIIPTSMMNEVSLEINTSINEILDKDQFNKKITQLEEKTVRVLTDAEWNEIANERELTKAQQRNINLDPDCKSYSYMDKIDDRVTHIEKLQACLMDCSAYDFEKLSASEVNKMPKSEQIEYHKNAEKLPNLKYDCNEYNKQMQIMIRHSQQILARNYQN